MADLDLAQDDPDEYEGRTVRWWGAEYVIGPFVAEGAERIVHQLVNVNSGLSAHLIKVLKDQESAPEPTLKMLAAYKVLREQGLPVVEDVELVNAHGGWFELDEAATLEADPYHVLMTKVRMAYEEGDLAVVTETCQEILVSSPQHTDALQFTARVRAEQGDLEGAIELGMNILAIEPNVRPYRFTLMEWSARAGLLDLFEGLFAEFKQKWPGEVRADDLAAEVALARGRPEAAQGFSLGNSAELRERVAAETAAAKKASAFLSKAAAALQRDKHDKVINYLSQAYAVYPKNPIVAINYGLALLRSADWEGSYGVLGSAIAVAPGPLRSSVLAAMAVCSLRMGNHERAAQMLEDAASMGAAPDGSLGYWDLPAVPIWVDDDQELRPRETAMVSTIDAIVAGLQDSLTPIPPALLALKDLYERGPDSDRDASGRPG